MDVVQDDIGDDVLRALVRVASARHLGDDRMPERAEQVDEERPGVVVVFRDEDANLRSRLSHRSRICVTVYASASLLDLDFLFHVCIAPTL